MLKEDKSYAKTDIAFIILSGLLYFLCIYLFHLTISYVTLSSILLSLLVFFQHNITLGIGIAVALLLFFGFLASADTQLYEDNSKYSYWVNAYFFINNMIFIPLVMIYLIFRLLFNFSDILILKGIIFLLTLLLYQNLLLVRFKEKQLNFYKYDVLEEIARSPGYITQIINPAIRSLSVIALFIMTYLLLGIFTSTLSYIIILWVAFSCLTFITLINGFSLKACVNIKLRNGRILSNVFLLRLDSKMGIVKILSPKGAEWLSNADVKSIDFNVDFSKPLKQKPT